MNIYPASQFVMFELIVYILLGVAIILTICHAASAQVRYSRRRSNAAKVSALMQAETPDSAAAPAADRNLDHDNATAATRLLIGDDAYEKMIHAIDNLLKRHMDDRCLSVELTGGPETSQGWESMGTLLPGDPVALRPNRHAGVPCVDVYNGDDRIGRIMFEDAASVWKVLDAADLTGAYVAQQNSFGNSDVASMRIIVFYKDRLKVNRTFAIPSPIRVDSPSGSHFTLFQN